MLKSRSPAYYCLLASISLLTLLHLEQTDASQLLEELKQCAQQQVSIKRLSCYDDLAEKYQINIDKNFIKPPREFLTSKLTVTPWDDEYTLSVKGFVDLIKKAVMDNGKKILIHGWTKQGHDYVLNITMRRPLEVKFLPFETGTDEIPLSLLRNLVIDGEISDPGLFITTIASMVPDEKTTKPK